MIKPRITIIPRMIVRLMASFMSRLQFVEDWIERSRESRYAAKLLATDCRVSRSQLGRFFLAVFFRPPQEWLDEVRIWDAVEVLVRGASVKEAGYQLYFADSSHFAHCFKRYHRFPPSVCREYMLGVMRRRPFFKEVPPWEYARRALLSPLHRHQIRKMRITDMSAHNRHEMITEDRFL